MRGKQAPKRVIEPDPKYNNVLLAKFVNTMMERGKKTVAQKVVYKAFDEIQKKTGKEPIQVFDLAIKNVAPILEVRSRRVGGANYQVPVEVRPDRRTALADRFRGMLRRIVQLGHRLVIMMRALRLQVEELLQAGKTQEAEKLMEDKRQLFAEQGYYIRRINQA